MTSTEPTSRKPRQNGRRASETPTSANQTQVTVYAGPDAVLDRQGRVLPIRPAAYPEVEPADGLTLRCLGCKKNLPVTRFQFIRNKGDGAGRFVECTPCQTRRLAENKQRRAAGQEPVPAPRAKVPTAAKSPSATGGAVRRV